MQDNTRREDMDDYIAETVSGKVRGFAEDGQVAFLGHKFCTCYFHFLVIYFFIISFIINSLIVYNKLLRRL